MATSIIKYDGDSTWKEGDTTASRPIKYKLRNGICFLTAYYSTEVSVGETPVLLDTLPAEYRPSTRVYFSVDNRGSTAQGYGYIDTSGGIYVRNTLGTMAYFSFSASYPVN